MLTKTPTSDPYRGLYFSYDLFSELFLKTHNTNPPNNDICYSTFFYELTMAKAQRPLIETALIDAFWLIHLFRHANINIGAADRLFDKGLLKLVPYEKDIDPHVEMTERGLAVVMRSLEDERVLNELFPFMEDVLFETYSERLPYDYFVTLAFIKEKGKTYLNLLEPQAFGKEGS